MKHMRQAGAERGHALAKIKVIIEIVVKSGDEIVL